MKEIDKDVKDEERLNKGRTFYIRLAKYLFQALERRGSLENKTMNQLADEALRLYFFLDKDLIHNAETIAKAYHVPVGVAVNNLAVHSVAWVEALYQVYGHDFHTLQRIFIKTKDSDDQPALPMKSTELFQNLKENFVRQLEREKAEIEEEG